MLLYELWHEIDVKEKKLLQKRIEATPGIVVWYDERKTLRARQVHMTKKLLLLVYLLLLLLRAEKYKFIFISIFFFGVKTWWITEWRWMDEDIYISSFFLYFASNLSVSRSIALTLFMPYNSILLFKFGERFSFVCFDIEQESDHKYFYQMAVPVVRGMNAEWIACDTIWLYMCEYTKAKEMDEKMKS